MAIGQNHSGLWPQLAPQEADACHLPPACPGGAGNFLFAAVSRQIKNIFLCALSVSAVKLGGNK